MSNIQLDDILNLINNRFDDASKTMTEMQNKIVDLARFEERLQSIDEKRKMDRQELAQKVQTILDKVEQNNHDIHDIKENQINLKVQHDNSLKIQEKTLVSLEKAVQRIDKLEKAQEKNTMVSGGISRVLWMIVSGAVGILIAITTGVIGIK